MAGRPKVGVQLPEVERYVRWPEYAAMARAAEETGFDSIWLGDHLIYREDHRPERGPWEAWTLLAGLAAVTEKVSLGPLVACTAFRPPGVLARTAAAVDEVSGGRLVLGLGAGWNEGEFTAFGIPYDNRASRFEEAFEVIRRLLAGERVTFHGDFTRVEDAVLRPNPARVPPLMVGSSGERVLRATLPHVAAWNTWFDLYRNTPEGFARESQKVTEIAESVGRDPAEVERSACLYVVIEGNPPLRHERGDVVPVGIGGLADSLGALAEAGADEVILVLDPITEDTVRAAAAAARL